MTDSQTENEKLIINEAIVRQLIATQFPQWQHLSIRPVASGGWDNKTFHLGDEMLVRMPSAKVYEFQVEKEQKWLPFLAPFLPLSIPIPLAMGEPDVNYPLKWSIYRWLKGKTLSSSNITNLKDIAISLANFLTVFHQIDSTGGPPPGLHSFYRGGELSTYDDETRRAITCLSGKIDTHAATEIWNKALETKWNNPPVWVHGDISVGNLLIKKGTLSAVIDFGQMTVGDPACDLAIAWTFFNGESRKAFMENMNLDADTWARGRAWTLWKALIVAAGFTNPNNAEAKQSLVIIEEVINDHKMDIPNNS